MRASSWLKVVGVCVAVLTLVAACYFFSLGVLYESGCHLGDAASCVNLTITLRLSLWLAVVFVVAGGCTGGITLRDALRARRARTAHPR
jgi:hypothetical protein